MEAAEIELHPLHQVAVDEGYDVQPDRYSMNVFDKIHQLKGKVYATYVTPPSLARSLNALAFLVSEVVSEPYRFDNGEWVSKADRPFIDATIEFLEKIVATNKTKGS
jgi:hypothetical protein